MDLHLVPTVSFNGPIRSLANNFSKILRSTVVKQRSQDAFFHSMDEKTHLETQRGAAKDGVTNVLLSPDAQLYGTR